jgi:hypothetical protein
MDVSSGFRGVNGAHAAAKIATRKNRQHMALKLARDALARITSECNDLP